MILESELWNTLSLSLTNNHNRRNLGGVINYKKKAKKERERECV